MIKHGAFGDMLQGFGTFAGLHAGLPDAHLALLTTPLFFNLAKRVPWFHKVLAALDRLRSG